MTLYREIAERIRCPEGSQKEAKKAFTDWHLSFHVLPQKWALVILGPRENTTQKIPRDCFGLPSVVFAGGKRPQQKGQKEKQRAFHDLVFEKQASNSGNRRARAKPLY